MQYLNPNIKQRISQVIYCKPVVYALYFGAGLFLVIKGLLSGQPPNNYLIFKHNFLNLIHEQNLYLQQPEFYFDRNHYGPVFAIVIAPFAILPDALGILLWILFNAFILLKAIELLPLKKNSYLVILLLCANDMAGSSMYFQFNPAIAALIIFSFYFIRKKQDFWAALMIALATFTKIYGIVGLAFIFFSDSKLKLIGSFIFWSVVLFLLPMAISSPEFIINTYHDWYADLFAKNSENAGSGMQDVSVMGFIRRVFNYSDFQNLFVIVPAIFVFGLSYLRTDNFKSTQYQLLILASVLIFTVIFSSSAESPTYVIAFTGVSIWFMNLNRPVTGLEIGLLIFAIIISSSPFPDLFPKAIKMYILPYRLKVLPCLLIWIKIIYETLTRKFGTKDTDITSEPLKTKMAILR
jgi:hypothetical protein